MKYYPRKFHLLQKKTVKSNKGNKNTYDIEKKLQDSKHKATRSILTLNINELSNLIKR